MDIEEGASQIVDAAVKIHIALGPGLLESAYQACLESFKNEQRDPADCESFVTLASFEFCGPKFYMELQRTRRILKNLCVLCGSNK